MVIITLVAAFANTALAAALRFHMPSFAIAYAMPALRYAYAAEARRAATPDMPVHTLRHIRLDSA